MSDPSCRTFRELLGVYVVGAIEPAERAAVDSHLGHCYECREELAELASLPAFLHRVPLPDAERLLGADAAAANLADPAPEVLNSLLRQVGARRRTKRLRSAFATAAALLIGIGGAAAFEQAINQPQQITRADVVRTSQNGVDVAVRYVRESWGTSMSVKATGLPQWTQCHFWIITKNGRRPLVGAWMVGASGNRLWYPVESTVPANQIRYFELTAGSRDLKIPVT
jgi:hypothetical protein